MKTHSTRRRFITRSLGSAAGVLFLSRARTAFGFDANSRLNLAIFGNRYNAAHFLTAAHAHNAGIVAFCSPDQREVPKVLATWKQQAVKLAGSAKPEDQQAAQQYQRLAERKDVQVFSDCRRMFADMQKQIDAVVVSDYEHFHGVVCGGALRLGKPVCNERPIGLNIDDARKLRALAAQAKVPVTYRSPGTGMAPFRHAMEMVEDGVIGPVKEVHVWFNRGGPDREQAPRGPQPVPEGLDWDLWLAPLAWREFHPDWMAYANWRETSNGGLGSFGPHTTIFPFAALKLRQLWDAPAGSTIIRVTAECARENRVSFPRWERVRWEIPARGPTPPVPITWHHGPDFGPGTKALIHEKLRQLDVPDVKEADTLMGQAGSILIGADGALVGNDHSTTITALPKSKFAKLIQRPQRVAASRGIYFDWTDAIRGGKPQILASFEQGGPLSELLMLGNIATQFPKTPLDYDPVSGQITNHREANQKRSSPYREGWSL